MSFERAVTFVLSHEGGVVEDPDDPGGVTNFGISQRAYPSEDIRGMTRERAKELYRRDYWEPCHCDDLPARLAILVFDTAVNMGTRAAVELLQTAVGTVPDGVIGPMTLGAAKRHASDDALLKMAAERGYRYGKIKTFDKFGRGWMRRLFAVTALALED